MRTITNTLPRMLWLILLVGIATMTAGLIASAPTPLASTRQASPSALTFADGTGTPLAGATVWVFCYGAEDLHGDRLLSEHFLTLDSEGQPTVALPEFCKRIAASHVIHEQPSGKAEHGPAYWVLAASWRTGSGTPDYDQPCWYDNVDCTITREPQGTIVLRADWPVVLFNVVASLEWTPAEENAVSREVRAGLISAASYLADLTDGYMTFGPTAIHSGGKQWDGADLRFHVTNDWQPSAFVGGIVPTPLEYEPGLGAEDPTFRPAAIFLGRAWDGDDASRGGWNTSPGYRTMVHEWAHYALFLYDEYQQFGRAADAAKAYCVSTAIEQLPTPPLTPAPGTMTLASAASAMAYQYTASELWHKDAHGSPPGCALSAQQRVHAADDWRTLEKWFAIQGLATVSARAPLVAPTTPVPEPSLPLSVTVDHRGSPRIAWKSRPNAAGGAGERVSWGPLGAFFGRSSQPPAVVTPTPVAQKIYLPAIHGPGSLRAAHAGSVTATMQDLPLMVLSNPIIYTKTVASQIYVRQEEAGTSALRLLYQGTLVAPVSDEFLGASALWGVQTTDQVITYIDQYAAREQSGAEIHAGGRFIGTDAAGNAIMDVVADPQQASLDLHYTMESSSAHELGRLTAVELRLTHAEAEAPPTATLCLPDAESQCVRKEMAGETTNWSTTFAAVEFAGSEQEAADAELPLYGVVEIEIPGHSTITRWFRDNGGVGTGHMVGTTPQREGRVMVNTLSVPPTFMPDYCNRVMVMPATSYAALKTPMEFVLVGYPLDLDVLFGLPDNQACQSEDQLVGRRLPAGVTSRLTLSYAEEQVTYLGVNETQLQIFRLTSNGWEPMNSDTLVDTTLNLVTAVIDTDGIYAIGWEQR